LQLGWAVIFTLKNLRLADMKNAKDRLVARKIRACEKDLAELYPRPSTMVKTHAKCTVIDLRNDELSKTEI